jgi:hypothetical protein
MFGNSQSYWEATYFTSTEQVKEGEFGIHSIISLMVFLWRRKECCPE